MSTEEFDKLINDGSKKYKLSGMYREWYLDYASYVILERAVPHIVDGLKPVQRRILHAMKLLDDGRYNKVSNIVGSTMQYHPHGDASIKDALVQLGQKNMLIDCQGNWGNILTGDSAAAGRYIEARLSKFALEVCFNNKITEWVPSYDGRKKEPVNLPVKFPLLLAQGSEGIAVGLASKILPHNVNELLESSIAILKGEDFDIYPDFPTGGMIDVSNYNEGKRGGKIRVRAKILKKDKNTLVITEIPFGETTTTVIDSIISANDKGKIRIKKIDDNTAANAEIIINLHNDVSPDKTIDALYATTNCEVSISPNCCVIMDEKPHFIGVKEILRHNTNTTKSLLQRELEIRLNELADSWHYLSLEKIFFENKVYKILENNASSWEKQLDDVMNGMLVYKDQLRRPITEEDIIKLVEKPVKKISKFDIKSVEDKIKSLEDEVLTVQHDLDNIVDYTIQYFQNLKDKYGKDYPRLTKLDNFENIAVAKVVANNAKLYANKTEGFIGTSPKNIDDAEYISDCSDIDDIIVFLKDGRYTVRKNAPKLFIDKNIIHVAVFNKADDRTTYNVIYKDGKTGTYYAKRFAIKGVTRDKWYDVTQGTNKSRIQYFTVNPNGEAECVKITLRPRPKLKKLIFNYDFAELAIKNKNARGNIVTKNPILRIQMISEGVSTIGARELWFDRDVNRINDEERGESLGKFMGNEHILVICKDGTYYTNDLDFSNRFQGNILQILKLDEKRVYTAIYYDGDSKFYYIKRFTFEISDNQPKCFISEAPGSKLIALSCDERPQIELTFPQTGHRDKDPEIVNVEEFISVKSVNAKGKRARNIAIDDIKFIDSLPVEQQETEEKNQEKEFNPGENIELDEEPTLF
ncbi:MAG: DNA gyrase/topoisomerase IV subunit A [Bacteroidales bacterium]